jgi:hypothetical protein
VTRQEKLTLLTTLIHRTFNGRLTKQAVYDVATGGANIKWPRVIPQDVRTMLIDFLGTELRLSERDQDVALTWRLNKAAKLILEVRVPINVRMDSQSGRSRNF